jgi:pentapeptide MXKDX repeat protein
LLIRLRKKARRKLPHRPLCNFSGGCDSHPWWQSTTTKLKGEKIMKNKILGIMAMCTLASSFSLFAQDTMKQDSSKDQIQSSDGIKNDNMKNDNMSGDNMKSGNSTSSKKTASKKKKTTQSSSSDNMKNDNMKNDNMKADQQDQMKH